MVRKIGKKDGRDELVQYTFEGEKRPVLPLTGRVSAETEPINGKKTYLFDPLLDPELQRIGNTEGTYYTIFNRKW